ncbi:MAG: 3-oxoacyl-ACP synthase, partial [Firmicutes bacterium]|nr:3-oxoacyl-ACP synthase [Bacillota bacterium]
MRSSRIAGMGSSIPEKVLTNFDLERMVDTSDTWIVERTGIRERHIVGEDVAASDLAVEAAWKALEDARVKASEVDL